MRLITISLIATILAGQSGVFGPSRFVGPVKFPAGSVGSATFTIIQHQLTETASTVSSLALTGLAPSTAGNTNLVCFGNSGVATSVSVTDNATGGSNTYTHETSADSITIAGPGILTYCYDSISTARGGATQVTATISATEPYMLVGFFEIHKSSGSVTFDAGGGVSSGVGVGTAVSGASVTTTGPTGFVAAMVIVNNGPITANPAGGNAFISGGDLSADGNAQASLLSLSATGHQPVWTDSASADDFAASTVSYK